MVVEHRECTHGDNQYILMPLACASRSDISFAL